MVPFSLGHAVLYFGSIEVESWGPGGFHFGRRQIVSYKIGIRENLTA
jgi:hypothetical protein